MWHAIFKLRCGLCQRASESLFSSFTQPSIMSTINLNCLISGDSPGQAFTVTVASNGNVSILKKAIKAERSNRFKDIDAADIQLCSRTISAGYRGRGAECQLSRGGYLGSATRHAQQERCVPLARSMFGTWWSAPSRSETESDNCTPPIVTGMQYRRY